jgi:hypothetical protein
MEMSGKGCTYMVLSKKFHNFSSIVDRYMEVVVRKHHVRRAPLDWKRSHPVEVVFGLVFFVQKPWMMAKHKNISRMHAVCILEPILEPPNLLVIKVDGPSRIAE